MKILIAAATEQEIFSCKKHFNKNDFFEFLVTGVGMVATAYSLGKHLQVNNYDLVINAGIAGSFNYNIKLGSVLQVNQDCFSELGAEDNNQFISINDLGFGKSTFINSYLIDNLKPASAITVNTVHGNEQTIAQIVNRVNPTLESMEGAAVAFVCEQENQKYLQIRSVSNYVENRNKDSWNIPLAIERLNQKVIEIIEAL